MEEFQKNIVHLLKASLDQQQKIEKRQEKLVMELHKQQLEFQQFTLQKTELQQKHFEELLVNSSNGSKISEKDSIFSQSTIYNSIKTFKYVPENDKMFKAFYFCKTYQVDHTVIFWPSVRAKCHSR